MSNIEIFGIPYLKKGNIVKCQEGTPKGGMMGPITENEMYEILDNKSLYRKYANREVDLDQEYRKKSKEQTIPFIKDKYIRLSKAGDLTTAKLSTNMLDSLAKYGALAGIPIETAIGLAAQETTFGKGEGDGTPQDVDPMYLVNDYAYVPNAYNSLIYTADKKAFNGDYSAKTYKILKALRDNFIEKGIPYAEKQLRKQIEERKNKSLLQHAFEYFKQGKYNLGDPNHTKDVQDAGKAAFNSPEIQKWWNIEGYKWYE